MKMIRKRVNTRRRDVKELQKLPFVHLSRIDVDNTQLDIDDTKLKASNSTPVKDYTTKCSLPVVRLERCNFTKYTSKKQKAKEHLQNKNSSVQTERVPKSKTLLVTETSEDPKKQKKIHINQQKNVTLTSVKFVDNELSETDEVEQGKILRERKQVNYKEKRSIGTPEVSNQENSNKKIPIYKRKLETPVSPKNHKRDQYAFVPESDEDSDTSFRIKTPAKKRKIVPCKKKKILVDTTKSTYVIQEGNHQTDVRKYKDKVDKMLNNLRSKITKKESRDRKKVQEKNYKILSNRKSIVDEKNKIFNSTQICDSFSVLYPEESIVCASERTMSSEREISVDLNLRNIREEIVPSRSPCGMNESSLKNVQSIQQFSDNRVLEDHLELDNSDRLSTHSFDDTVCTKDHKSEGIESCFGFDDGEIGENTQKGSRNVNIVQDIILTTPHMTNPRIIQPWRFNVDYVSRNPHFIDLKKNSLPSLNQDPVLDHTFDDNIQRFNKTIVIPGENKISPKQQSILNFIQTNKEHNEKVTLRQSLFDIEELSPIKKKDKENLVENTKKIEKRDVARRILGELNENLPTKDTSTPVKTYKVGPKQSDLSIIENDPDNNFGFDNDSSLEIKNNNNEKNEKESEPFRLELFSCKKYSGRKLPKKFMEPVRESEMKRLIEDDPGFDRLVEEDNLDCREVKLFEDIEDSEQITKDYKAKTKKRVLDDLEKPKKHAEAKLSKEAKNWIKQFNQMCDEVDQVELEIA